MSIKYSGLPITYLEYSIDTQDLKYTGMIDALQHAGWTDLGAIPGLPNATLSEGRTLKSMKTPQGLQMKLEIYKQVASNNLWYRPVSNSGLTLPYRWLRGYATSGLRERMIANGYQFFTFVYRDENSSGAGLLMGCPWLPEYLEPVRVADVIPGSPTRIRTYPEHRWVSGQVVILDCVEGVPGINLSWIIDVVDEFEVSLRGSNLAGTPVPFTGVAASQDRVATCIWAQSATYANYWLDSTPCETLRTGLNSVPSSNLYTYIDVGCNAGILNRGCWTIPDDAGWGYKNAYTHCWQLLAVGRNWHGGSVVGYEPLLMMGEASEGTRPKVVGQLWDSLCVNSAFPRLDQDVRFDGATWHVYTGPSTTDGSLLLKIDVNL